MATSEEPRALSLCPICQGPTMVVGDAERGGVWLRHGDPPDATLFLTLSSVTELGPEALHARIERWIYAVHDLKRDE